jgi:hypothetical protein
VIVVQALIISVPSILSWGDYAQHTVYHYDYCRDVVISDGPDALYPCPSDVRQTLQVQVERAMRYLNTGDKYYVEQAQQILESVARQQRNFNCTKADVLRGLPSWLLPPR